MINWTHCEVENETAGAGNVNGQWSVIVTTVMIIRVLIAERLMLFKGFYIINILKYL